MQPEQAGLEPNQISVPQKHSHRFVWIFLSVFILLMISGLWVFGYMNKNRVVRYGCSPGDVQGPFTDCMYDPNLNIDSEWKTYVNEAYGFKVGYPVGAGVNWVENKEKGVVLLNIYLPSYTFTLDYNYFGDDGLTEYESRDEIADGRSLYVKTYTDSLSKGKYLVTGQYCNNDCPDSPVNNKNESNIVLSLTCDIKLNTNEEKRNCNNLFDKFVQSLKFTNTLDTSAWKTYKADKYGFQFQYPGQWESFSIDSTNIIGFKIKSEQPNIPLALQVTIENSFADFKMRYGLEENDYRSYIKGESFPFSKKIINGTDWFCFVDEGNGPRDSVNCSTERSNGNIIFMSFSASDIILNKILSSFKFTNNYDSFDPDGTLSDISASPVFVRWLKSKNIGFEKIEGGHFSSKDLAGEVFNSVDYCKNADSSKKFTSPNGERVTCFFSGEEPDSDLYLYGETDNSSKRIDFCGTPCMYETGFWLDGNKFVFLFTVYDQEYEGKMQKYKEYIVEMFDLGTNKTYQWGSMRQYY